MMFSQMQKIGDRPAEQDVINAFRHNRRITDSTKDHYDGGAHLTTGTEKKEDTG